MMAADATAPAAPVIDLYSESARAAAPPAAQASAPAGELTAPPMQVGRANGEPTGQKKRPAEEVIQLEEAMVDDSRADAWSDAGTPGGGEGTQKASRRPHQTESANTMPLPALAAAITGTKADLNAQWRLRIMEGTIFYSFLGPKALTEDAEASSKAHAAKHKGESGHKGGPPFVHGWRRLMVRLCEDKVTIAESGCKEEIEIIEKHLKELEQAPPSQAHLLVRHARFLTCRSEAAAGKSVATFAVSTINPDYTLLTRAILKVVMVIYGAEVCQGTAPKSPLERQLEKDLQRLTAIYERRSK